MILSFTGLVGAGLPDDFYVRYGESLNIGNQIYTAYKNDSLSTANAISDSGQSGTVALKYQGILPIKEVSVNYIEEIQVVPCGVAFGIKMFTAGVVVVRTADVDSEQGLVCPAALAGIKTGDVITSIDGKVVETNEQVAELINASGGKEIILSINRKNLGFDITITPVKSNYDGEYKGGIWVRDSSAGIGTMTFYNEENGTFGGLGHPVCDVETGEILPLMSGEIVAVDITGINKGVGGVPGELRGSFSSNGIRGNLLMNTETGVYGTLNANPTDHSPIPLGLRQEIEIGEATILCTLDGGDPQEFSVNIENVDLSGSNPTKNMVIRVTDPLLLEATGGIVQGMSGSPIIQNGKLVGAVTHVFVNDPAKGYGIFAENMVKTSSHLMELSLTH